MDWLKKTPIVSALIAVAMVAVPLVLNQDIGSTMEQFEKSRDEARDYLVRNPSLAVDSLGSLILDPDWLEEARAAAEASQSSASVELPTRMLARSQTKLDNLVERAYEDRMKADPAWRLGVLGARTPPENYVAHAFVHETIVGVALCVAVLMLVGAPLERSWGSGIFALFTVIAIPLTAQGYRLLDASSGVPWSGSAGLAGALLGAYFIRGLGGHFIVPAWLLLPVWLGVESVVVREFWIDDLSSGPWASLCAAIGFGALAAGALRLIGVESMVDARRAGASRLAPNPVISRTARLRSDGDPHQAFDLIQAAWRDHPADREIAETFFSVAVEVGQPGAAAKAIIPSLNDALRAGDTPRALEYWLPIATAEADVHLESTAAVRLGEALLDVGHPEQAIFSLRIALDAGIPSAQALRIVNVARDLDESLARQAATIALSDATLDPRHRAELEGINFSGPGSAVPTTDASGLDAATPTAVAPADTASDGSAQDALRAEAEHQTVETTAFPLSADASTGFGGEGAMPTSDEDTASVATGETESQLIDQNLDQGALSAESLGGDTRILNGDADVPTGGDSGDVLSHWSDATRVENSGYDPGDDPGETVIQESDLLSTTEDEDLFGTSLSMPIPSDVLGDEIDADEAETDSDLTPLMEASEELTSPYDSKPPADELTMLAGSSSAKQGDEPDELEGVEDQHTVVVQPELDAPPSSESAEMSVAPDPAETVVANDEAPDSPPLNDDFAIGVDRPEEQPVTMRELKAVEAVPVDQNEEWIEIDVDERGKSKLPFERIEAIIVAGITGLASRPVLLVDFALNWSADRGEPLKVIRFRSDRFDPRDFEGQGLNPLEALTAWVKRLQDRSQATCLPSTAILEGRYARYESLEAYENEVLHAMRVN